MLDLLKHAKNRELFSKPKVELFNIYLHILKCEAVRTQTAFDGRGWRRGEKETIIICWKLNQSKSNAPRLTLFAFFFQFYYLCNIFAIVSLFTVFFYLPFRVQWPICLQPILCLRRHLVTVPAIKLPPLYCSMLQPAVPIASTPSLFKVQAFEALLFLVSCLLMTYFLVWDGVVPPMCR